MSDYPLDDLKAEREQLERDIAEREATIARFARERCAETSSREEVRCYDRTPRPDTIVTKSQPMTSVTTEWQSYIDRVCKSWLAASMEAVATALREMQDKAQAEREAMRKELRDEFKAELAQIRIELLTKMVDSERGKRHLKAVPESNAMVG